MLRIYTSYFDNLENIPNHIIQISIAGKSAKNYKGLEYKKLAPKLKFWKVWEKQKIMIIILNILKQK